MSARQKVLYFLSSLFVLLAIAFIEFFVISEIIDVVTTNWLIHLILFIIALIFINPFIGVYLIGKLPFKVKGLTDINKLKTAINPDILNVGNGLKPKRESRINKA